MTFSVSQKTKCPTGSPVLFHDFSDPGSDKVKVKRQTSRQSHSMTKDYYIFSLCVCVYSPTPKHMTEYIINSICLRKTQTGINPPGCDSCVTLLILNTNLNFSKALGNQFVLEKHRPLRPPFDSLKIRIDSSNWQGPDHIRCSLQ